MQKNQCFKAHLQLAIRSAKVPKAARKSVHETSETEFQEDSNISQESGSEEEVVLQYPPSTSQTQAAQQVYMTLHRGAKNGMDCE